MENIPEFKDVNVEQLEERLRIFLTEILKVKIDRGDLYQTYFSLSPENRGRFIKFGGLSEKEKKYIDQRTT